MRAFAADTVAVLDLAVNSYDYSRKQGFKDLPHLLQVCFALQQQAPKEWPKQSLVP